LLQQKDFGTPFGRLEEYSTSNVLVVDCSVDDHLADLAASVVAATAVHLAPDRAIPGGKGARHVLPPRILLHPRGMLCKELQLHPVRNAAGIKQEAFLDFLSLLICHLIADAVQGKGRIPLRIQLTRDCGAE
jgi:hypothetical protein